MNSSVTVELLEKQNRKNNNATVHWNKSYRRMFSFLSSELCIAVKALICWSVRSHGLQMKSIHFTWPSSSSKAWHQHRFSREGNGTPLQYSCLENPMEEPGGLQFLGSLTVGHDWATSLSLFTFMHWRRKWQPTPVFLPGESQGRRSLLGCHLMGSHRVGHDWSDLAAAAAAT